MKIFTFYNGANAQAAAQPGVATGTSIKTMLQLKSTVGLWIVDWGFSFNGAVANTPGHVELIDTNTVAATSLTAAVDNDFTKVGQVSDIAEADDLGITYGTGATGYTAGAEGTVNARCRVLDALYAPPTGPYVRERALNREWWLPAANYLRIRAHFGTDVNMKCFISFGI
jgi:hypothetical protein